MNTLTDRIKSLPPDKLNTLFRQLKPGASSAPPPAARRSRPFRAAEDQNFALVVTRPGILETLAFQRRPRLPAAAYGTPSAADVIEIEIRAASLNFRDVAIALGMYPVPPGQPPPQLGCDGAGVVTAVGSNVTRFKVGDEVLSRCALTFARYGYTTEAATRAKPPQTTFEQAAGIPLAFITAYYGLHTVGRLRAGERVLIHSAAGGVGLAAVQVARLVGAEIFATVGTQAKREYLHGLGIEHVMDSRSPSYIDAVKEHTRGEGVDVVLNSLTGDAIGEGIRLLRPLGRFVELGKRDLVAGRALDLEPFRRSLTFSAVDIGQMSAEAVSPVMDAVDRHFAGGAFQPLPTQVFPVSKVADAFRFMTQGTHIGKIVIAMQSGPVLIDV